MNRLNVKKVEDREMKRGFSRNVRRIRDESNFYGGSGFLTKIQ